MGWSEASATRPGIEKEVEVVDDDDDDGIAEDRNDGEDESCDEEDEDRFCYHR